MAEKLSARRTFLRHNRQRPVENIVLPSQSNIEHRVEENANLIDWIIMNLMMSGFRDDFNQHRTRGGRRHLSDGPSADFTSCLENLAYTDIKITLAKTGALPRARYALLH